MTRAELTDADWRRLLRDPLPGGDLPRCICGEEVAVPHAECIAMYVPLGPH